MKYVVTGANGHLGHTLTKELLYQGYETVATVRKSCPPTVVKHLKSLGAEVIYADILDTDSLHKAFKNADGIFHSAAPNVPWAEDLAQDILKPILQGTKNVLQVAQNSQIQNIVFTASAANVGLNSEFPLAEENWSAPHKSTLLLAKQIAEKWAWDFAYQHQLNFKSICPPSILGPNFWRHTATTKIYSDALKKRLPPFPRMGFHISDARDVASAHILAMKEPYSRERYIAAGEYIDTSTLIEILKEVRPSIRTTSFKVSKSVLFCASGLDWMNNKLTGKPRQLTNSLVSDFSDKYQRLSSNKIMKNLNWKYRPLTETLHDTFEWIERNNL